MTHVRLPRRGNPLTLGPVSGVGNVLVEVVALLGFMVLACYWTFGSRGVRRTRPRPDYGLLSVVRRTDTHDAALVIQRQLADAGIRATVAPAGNGFTAAGHAWPATAHVVLVFPGDQAAARQALADLATP